MYPANIHRRIYGVGLTSVYSSFVVVTYYMLVISWSVYYFFATMLSFNHMYWAYDSEYADDCEN